jgi:hypothetical protein
MSHEHASKSSQIILVPTGIASRNVRIESCGCHLQFPVAKSLDPSSDMQVFFFWHYEGTLADDEGRQSREAGIVGCADSAVCNAHLSGRSPLPPTPDGIKVGLHG